MADDDFLTNFGDIIFSIVIGYVGALEFLYVVRHLYHWSFRHSEKNAGGGGDPNDPQSLERLKADMRQKLADAKAKEAAANAANANANANATGTPTTVMQDGVLYKDGFRIDPQQQEIDQLKEQKRAQEAKEARRKEIEAELAEQRRIEEETRRQLEEAEAELARQRRREAEEAQEAAENAKRLVEAERQREEEQRRKEEEEQEEAENMRKMLEAERQREEEQRRKEEEEQEEAENMRKIMEAERQREEEQRRKEEEQEEAENMRKIMEAERQREEEQRLKGEAERSATNEAAEDSRKLIEAEQEREREKKQKAIEENARRFLEAEQEMVALQQQQQMLERPHSRIERSELPVAPIDDDNDNDNENDNDDTPTFAPTVKTQFSQIAAEPYAPRSTATKTSLAFPGISDEGSSIEPISSSEQSSFSPQPSEDFATSAASGEETIRTPVGVAVPYLELESRQEPDGEDTSPAVQYTEEYLRSLDGIGKNRPLVREDGSGRRRAFKKRRSSGSSTSSRESRTSREEEVKMFTSLEEEESESMRQGGDDFTPIKYTTTSSSSEPLLKVKGHQKRHKRSPAKDAKPMVTAGDESMRGSLEMLGEEESSSVDPWGEVVPEHYKHTEFWRREKAMSIDEEEIEFERPSMALGVDGGDASGADATSETAATNVPKKSSFEEATQAENEGAMNALQQQQQQSEQAAEGEPKTGEEVNAAVDVDVDEEGATNEYNKNLKTSPARSSTSPRSPSSSPRLRRSPRIDEMDQYEERWRKSTESLPQPPPPPPSNEPPSIAVHGPVDNGPWRDEHGLLWEGLSDFYDFTASVNPSRSRSRSTSRNPSPLSSLPSSPTPKSPDNVAYEHREESVGIVDVYDDTGVLEENEFNQANIYRFIHTPNDPELATSPSRGSPSIAVHLTNVSDDRPGETDRRPGDDVRGLQLIPTLCVQADEDAAIDSAEAVETAKGSTPADDMAAFVQSLRADRIRSRSRSRSRSPLPTADNIQRSLDMRRNRKIQQNDEIRESLIGPSPQSSESTEQEGETHGGKLPSNSLPAISVECVPDADAVEEEDVECSRENMARLVESLRMSRSRSRSRSPMPHMSAGNPEVLDRFMEGRGRTPEPEAAVLQHGQQAAAAAATGDEDDDDRNRQSRSRTPSPPEVRDYQFVERPRTEPNFEWYDRPGVPPMGAQELDDRYDFSLNRKTAIEEAFEKEHRVDIEALDRMRMAREEIELRTDLDDDSFASASASTAARTLDVANQRLRQLRCSPTTPDYERTISEEWQDVQRIKEQMLTGGFKRSTYVGESLDLARGDDRAAAERFQRSQSPSPSFSEEELARARRIAAEKQNVQASILAELTTATETAASTEPATPTLTASEEISKQGAIPKNLRRPSATSDYERSLSNELTDTMRIKEDLLSRGFQRSTYVGESVDLSTQMEAMRREAAEFRRSRSRSRSPPHADQAHQIERIDAEAVKRGVQDNVLDEIEMNTRTFQDFSRYLNVDFLDSERRASDSALIRRPEILIQLQDNDAGDDDYMDPDDYHHFRRYSLDQEQPVEEYPNDDYVYVSQIEVRTMTGTRTWIREDFYSEDIDLDDVEAAVAVAAAGSESMLAVELMNDDDDDSDDGSEDERRTVVEVEDEIDEDICDFNERGVTDESHHEQSECEEADREMDHFAGRGANDWIEVEHTNAIFRNGVEGDVGVDVDMGDGNEAHVNDEEDVVEEEEGVGEEGAIGGSVVGSAYDSDSFAIDQMYDEAIKNRKQSGIQRDYDCILKDMQENFVENGEKPSNDEPTENTDRKEQYAIWAKTRAIQQPTATSSPGVASSAAFLANERQESEMRYLGDAMMTPHQSTRLRSRYGYVPVLQASSGDDLRVDLTYQPRREYNWRKNFKLDDDDEGEVGDDNDNDNGNDDRRCPSDDRNGGDMEHVDLEGLGDNEFDDMRKYSLGGESITLYSRSPDREVLEDVAEETAPPGGDDDPTAKMDLAKDSPKVNADVVVEKVKKKKSKKKSRKNSTDQKTANADDDDSENQQSPYSPAYNSRRSSSLQMDAVRDSPKRWSRSRRSSKSSVTNDDAPALMQSPRGSVAGGGGGCGESMAVEDEVNAYGGGQSTNGPGENKKKSKKRKKAKDSYATEPKIKEEQIEADDGSEMEVEVGRSNGRSTQATIALSSRATAASTSAEPAEPKHAPTTMTPTTPTTSSTSTTTTTGITSFDILKDANFYPLF